MICLVYADDVEVQKQCWVCIPCWSVSYVANFYCCQTWHMWVVLYTCARLWNEQCIVSLELPCMLICGMYELCCEIGMKYCIELLAVNRLMCM